MDLELRWLEYAVPFGKRDGGLLMRVLQWRTYDAAHNENEWANPDAGWTEWAEVPVVRESK